jgi:hypothetical protein
VFGWETVAPPSAGTPVGQLAITQPVPLPAAVQMVSALAPTGAASRMSATAASAFPNTTRTVPGHARLAQDLAVRETAHAGGIGSLSRR